MIWKKTGENETEYDRISDNDDNDNDDNDNDDNVIDNDTAVTVVILLISSGERPGSSLDDFAHPIIHSPFISKSKLPIDGRMNEPTYE